MTIPRVLEINKYQAHSPPLHLMVAVYLGYGKSSTSKPSELDENGQSLLDIMPQRG